MREIKKDVFINSVVSMLKDANFRLDKSTLLTIKQAKEKENNELGKRILTQIIENEEIASSKEMPLCQDTGMVVVFLEIGKVLLNFDIYEATNEAVKIAYEEGYLRKSVLNHPIERINTLDNTPAVIHTKVTQDDSLKITVAPKGGGAENMSRIQMLTPSSGREGVVNFVLETINLAGGKACPPFVVGVGIGGNLEQCAILAKEALMRPIEDMSSNTIDASLEIELLDLINESNIGPMGFGGSTTALSVKVNSYPCHIASLPVAVNIQCHSSRHRSVIL